jgi:phage shock protein A
MTPEERLSQIEALFATAAKYTTRHEAAITRQEEAIARQEEAIARHEEVIVRHEEAIVRHEETLERLDNQVIDLNFKLAETVEIMRDLASYQRQSQEEIQRIWQYLMSQNTNGHSS